MNKCAEASEFTSAFGGATSSRLAPTKSAHRADISQRSRNIRAKFLLLAGLAALVSNSSRAAIETGDLFPSLAAANLAGGTLPPVAGKILLVDFWASWCAPCKASFAALGRLNAEFASRGLVIVAISVDEKPAAYRAFVQKWQPPFAALLDRGQNLVRTVQVPAMPTSYLVGPDGRVRFVHRGFHGGATEAEWRAHIEALLGGKPESAS